MKSTIHKTSTEETNMKQNDIKYDVKILNKAGGRVKWMHVVVRMHLNLKLSFKNNHLHMNIYIPKNYYKHTKKKQESKYNTT